MTAKPTQTKAKKTPTKDQPKPTPISGGAVSDLLRKRRQQLGLSLSQVELATRIRGKYLRQLEAGDYSQLPHDIYSRGFVQSYASYMGMETREVVRRYEAERGGPPISPRRLRPVATTRTTVVPRLLTVLIILGAVVGFGLYLSLQLQSLTGAPGLEVTSPSKDQSVYGNVIDISGHVAGGADVTVNQSPLLTDTNGNFTDKIALQNGVNTIQVVAKNRLGKTTTITRNILASVPQPTADSQVPQATFDGIAAAVAITGSATKIVVKVDGAQAFNGTMLPGTVQTFKAKDKVTIETANAGNTGVTISNTTTANRVITPLGKSGEAKRDFEFAKDTSFQ